jgi:hypothetical protein
MQSHTIVLFQFTERITTRSYQDYENVGAALDGLLFAATVSDLHASPRNLPALREQVEGMSYLALHHAVYFLVLCFLTCSAANEP